MIVDNHLVYGEWWKSHADRLPETPYGSPEVTKVLFSMFHINIGSTVIWNRYSTNLIPLSMFYYWNVFLWLQMSPTERQAIDRFYVEVTTKRQEADGDCPIVASWRLPKLTESPDSSLWHSFIILKKKLQTE